MNLENRCWTRWGCDAIDKKCSTWLNHLPWPSRNLNKGPVSWYRLIIQWERSLVTVAWLTVNQECQVNPCKTYMSPVHRKHARFSQWNLYTAYRVQVSLVSLTANRINTRHECKNSMNPKFLDFMADGFPVSNII